MTIFHTIAAGGGNLLRSFRITAKLVFLLVCLSSGQAWAQVPDLTAGGVPTSTQTLNLGPTGMRGWLYHDKIDTSASRQILVTAVDQWSPAEPVMAVNDVILGADGTGADPVAFSSDAYWALAGAIAAAETNSPATLKLLRWRSGSTTNVAITLETLGAYSATAPYNCPKSAAILEKGLAYVQAHSSLGGRNQWGALALLAGNDAANPNNSARQALAASQVQNLILDADKLAEMNKDETYSDGGKNAWWISHQLVVTAEYYLKTGDTNVLPSIAAYAHAFAMGQSMFGTTGHIFAYGEWPDGSQPGNIMAGYGPINMTGTTGLYGMLLAKQCGVVDAQVDAGIERASRFFRFYTNKGSIPYGEHGPWHTHENQGKMSILALCYEMQAGYEAESKWFSRCAAAYLGNEGWFDGHTGPFFQQFWPMLGAAVGGQEAAAARFNEMKGHYDMMRRWDGSFVFNSLTYGFIGADYNDFPARVIPLLTYALPLQQLRMTGAGQDLTPLTTPEVTETIAAGQYDATAQTTNSLLSDLGSWSFVVRNAAAVEIGERTAAHAALLPTLTTMANDTGGGNSRYGAIKALGIIADASSAPVLAALLTDADNHVRMLATEALSSHPNKASQMETMLAAVTSTARPLLPLDEEDPMQYAHGDLTHMIGGLVGYDSSVSIDQIDRTLLNPAIRAMSATARGGARSWAVQNIFPKLTLEQAYELADCIVDTAYYRAPADAMFSAAARVEATRVLQRYDIAEGVPLAILLEDQDIASSLTILKGYAGAAPIVQPDAGVYDYLDSLSTAYITQKGDVLAAIAADVFPIPATPYKSITVVTPDAPALTLPANRTTLHVNGADPVGDALYTWRKVYGRGNVVITPSGTSSGKDALVQFDGTPGLYCFEVTMHDRRNLSEVLGTVIVTLNDTGGTLPSNAPPVATSQSITVNQSTPQLVTLIATDPEGYDLSYTVTASPAHGSLVGTAPYLIYHPDLPYVGGDSMSFEVMDSEGQTDSATITISVETLSPLGLAVYEPFDYPAGLLNGASGTNAIGLTNAWAARTDVEMVSGSPSIANALTAGGKVKTPTWGKRSISSTALVDNGLLDDGATLWMSCMVGYMPGISSGQLRMALANNHLHDYNGSQRIVDDGAQAGHGVGWFFYQGNVSAACYRNDNTLYLSGSSSVSRFAVSEVRLLVAKFSWAANTNDPDRIELYYVGDDMLLPAQSLSSLNAVVDQSQYDVLTFREYYNDGTLLDEIRLGDSFQSVIAGTVPMTPDVSAPTPDPALFTVPPTMLNATSVTMTAATAYDPSEVEYAFVCTVGGGNSSGWQSSPIYIDTGLTPGVEYRYTVQARDGMAVPHTTAISAEAAVTLPANTTVPDMVGLLQVQGENLLASAQLILGTVSNVYDATAVVDEIISQTPVAGSTVTVTSAVNVTVSLGRDPTLAPLLVSIVDDVSGGPVQVADPILYTITFSEDMDAATVGLDDFGNAGTASSVTLSDLSELSPGVFRLKAVPMTPGTLQLQINSAAVLTDAAATALDTTTAIPDDTTLTINPVGLVVYEPFDYPVGSLANKKGLSEIGLAGIWSSASWVRSGAPVYGLLATEGNWLSDTTGWINGDARMLSSSAVAERRLLEDGATLWFSMLIGNYQGTGAKITVALANSRFHWYYIVDPADAFGVKIADGEGVGIWFGGENGSGAAGCLQAAHFSGGPSGETVGTTRVSFGDWSGTPLGDAEVGLLVGKFTWNANPANPDTIDVYQVGTDLLLPATPVSTLNVTVDQSILNTLTFHHDGAYALDEIRFGGSYASVVPVDFTPPTLGNDDFVDDQVGGPILENTLVTYTVTFSEDIDAATVSAADFENRASTAITFGAITETTAPGVFTVEVTPTEPGELRLQVAAGASIADLAGNLLDTTWAIFDYTLITVNLDNLPPTWSSNPVSTADGEELVAFNGDLSLLASDPDLDSLTFTKLAGPSWLNVASNGTLSGTPGTGTSGVNTFTVSVKDPFYPAVEVTLNIYVVLPGATPPTLAAVDIVDDQTGGPVQMNDLLVYTVTFSEDIDAATVVAGDFANAGDSSITVGAITETSPGVFTVEVTPSTAGTLRLQVRAGASILDVDEAAPLDTSVAIVDVDIITVEPPPMVIYEPFDYAPAAISSITQGSGTSDFGLDGDYLGSGYCQVKYLSFGHGSLLVQGNGFRLDGRNLALARDVSQTALTDSGLLRNGATLWFSMVYGTQADASLLPSIGFTLANGSFASGIANYYIENWDGEEPSGLGFYYGYLDGVNGRVAAAQYRSINYGSGSSGKVLGTREAGTVALGVGESRLVVGKITWAADSADPDTIELYQPGTDMLLPASPISTLSVVVDQATYDTISVMCDYRGLLDELRFGSSYDGVVPLDTTPPTLAAGNIVDNRGGADIMQNEIVQYTVTFSEQMDASSLGATDFTNAGTASITVGAIAQIRPGVFTIEVTPTSGGTLQLRVPAGATIDDLAGNPLNTTAAVDDDTSITSLADVGNPTLVSIVDNRSGANIVPNAPVIYTITFSEDMDPATIGTNDFSNAGTASITIGTLAQVSLSVYQLQVTPTGPDPSTLQLQISAGAILTDAAANPLSTSLALADDTTIVVSADPEPEWNTDPIVEIDADEDAAYGSTLADDASDFYTNTLTFSKVAGPAWLSVGSDGLLSGTPLNADVGLNSFTVDVTDDIYIVPVTLQITVINVNDAPEFTPNPFSTGDATEDIAYSDSIAAFGGDVDGDPLVFQKTGGPDWLAVAADGTLSGTPTHSDNGTNTFTVQADDSNGGVTPGQLVIVVLPVNDGPVFVADPFTLANATEDALYGATLAGTAEDEEGDSVTYAKVSGPAWLSVDPSGALSGTPSNDDVGLNEFIVSARDGINPSVAQGTLRITVMNSNDAPEFAVPAQLFDAMDTVLYTDALTKVSFDVDGDTMTYSKVSGPDWASVAPDGTVTGTPGTGDIGTATLTIDVTDSIVGTPTQGTVTIKVRPYTAELVHIALPPMNMDSWSIDGNWADGNGGGWQPYGAINVAVAEGKFANVRGTGTLPYVGNLTLRRNAKLLTATDLANMNALGTGVITMEEGAELFMTPANQSRTISNPIVLSGDAALYAGYDNYNTVSLTLNGGVTGDYILKLGSAKKGKFYLNASNSVSGLNAIRLGTENSEVYANVIGSLGLGNVSVNTQVSLFINAANIIADTAALMLNGLPSSNAGVAAKLIMNANDTVNALYIDGVAQPAGVYNNTETWLAGAGVLTVSTLGAALDTTRPTLAPADIVDDQPAEPIGVGTLITYTLTFSEGMHDQSLDVSDFVNAGSAPITIGAITEVSSNVFTVAVTPTAAGTLQLQIPAGAVLKDLARNAMDTASAITDDTTITVAVPGITVSAISGNTTENGGTATFTIRLDIEPATNVLIGLSSDTLSEGTVSPTGVTFTVLNWDSPQTVTVTGVEDALDDGDQLYHAVTAAATSGDAGYDGLNAADVSVTNLDDDFTLTVTGGLGVDATTGSGAVDMDDSPYAISATAAVGYTFLNWEFVAGTGSFSNAGSASTAVTTAAPATVNAVFDPDTFSVTYDANGGDGGSAPGAQVKVYNVNLTLATNTAALAKSGFTFDGWNTASDGSGTDYAEGATYSANADLTLYPKWGLLPTVATFNPANGATNVSPYGLLQVTFSEDVVFGIGNITLRESDGTEVESFDVGTPPSGLTLSGATVTLEPTAYLAVSNTYYIEIDATAIDDLLGNSFAGFSGDGTWSFTTPDIMPSATITHVGIQFNMELETNDPTVGWRNTTPLKPLDIDGDNIIGTDGYRISNKSANPAYATTSDLAPNKNGSSYIDNPTNPSGDDGVVGNFHDNAAGTGVETAPLLGFVTTRPFPLGETLRIGVLVDEGGSANGLNTATYTLKQTVGGSARATSPAYPWQNGSLDVVFFDLVDCKPGDTFVVTATSVYTPEYPGAFEQVMGITFDSGITLSAAIADAEISEDGGTTTATISRLDSVGDLVVSMTSSDTNEAVVSATATILDGSSSVDVTITGVPDGIIDGAQTVTITATADGYCQAIVSLDITDADRSGFVLNKSSVTVAEDGGTASLSVVLDTQPTSDVVLDIVSSDANEATVSPASLTLTSVNWNQAQTVTVTGVNDFVDRDDTATLTVSVNDAASDNAFDAFADQSVAVTCSNDDTLGFALSTSSVTVAEDSGTSSFTVVLTSQPGSNVVFDVTSSDASEATVSPASLTFTSSNWNQAQSVTVTGVNDFLDRDDTATATVSVNAGSSDDAFDALADQTVAVTCTNDDTLGIVVSAISGDTTESGASATFTVVLGTQPTGSVTIGISCNDLSEGAVAPSSLTFTTDNWSTAQVVTVTGEDDGLTDGDVTYTILTGIASSTDTDYDGLNPDDVTVINADNDQPDILVSSISGSTTENGTAATFTVVLNTLPTATVTLGISSDDESEGTASPTSLAFTTGDWNVPQTVTVTGADDSLDDGDVSYSILTSVASSTDTDYDGFNADDVTVSNMDDDFTLTVLYGAGGAAASGGGIKDEDNSPFAITATPAAGYHFTNWTVTAGTAVVTDTNSASTTVSATDNASVQANFAINTYTVSYNANGATGGTVPSSQTKTYAVNLTLATNSGALVKTGFTLDGWNSASDGSGTDYAEGATYSANADLTLYPKWGLPPTVATFSPANGATNASPYGILQIIFSENVVFGTGNITLRESGGALVESFDVATPPAGLTRSGATISLDPTADLALSTTYYIEIDATAIEDLLGNSFAGFSGDGTWSFTTPAIMPSASITHVGIQFNMELKTDDPTVGWRNSTPLKPLDIDGDNLIGTDGYRIYYSGNHRFVNPTYATSSALAPSRNGPYSLSDNPTAPSGPDTGLSVFHDGSAAKGVESGPLLGFVITRAFPVGETLRVGILVDATGSANGSNKATYTLKQTVGGSASATSPAYPWQDGTLDVVFFDLVDFKPGDTFVVTSKTSADNTEYPSDFEQVLGITFDSGIIHPLTVSIADAAISEDGGTTIATISRVGTIGDWPVALTSSDPGEATVPASVTIPNGSNSVAVTITGVADGINDGTATVTITATAAGSTPGNDTVDVTNVDPTDYAVTYDGNGSESGTVPVDTSSPYSFGASVTVLGNTGALSRASYTFDGWNTAADGSGSGYAAADSFVLAGTTVLYAQWTPIVCTVTFDPNGGDAPSPATQLATLGSPYGALATVSRTGYTLNGWFTAASGGTQVTDITEVTALVDHTLYAQWTFNIYTVTFVVTTNGTHTGGGDLVQSINHGSAATEPTVEVATAGWIFAGWDTAFDNVTSDRTVTAQYIPAALTIAITDVSVSEGTGAAATTGTVSRNSDTNSALTVTLSSDNTAEATVPVSVEIPAGQTSVGFAIDAIDDLLLDGTQTVTITATAADHVDGTNTFDVTDDEHAVSYDGNGNTGGTAPADQVKVNGVDLVLASEGDLVNGARTFVGWNSSADGSGDAYATGAVYTSEANITLYAKWSNDLPTVNAGPDQTVLLTEGTWSPLDLGVDLWLDADDAATLQLNGSTVSNWVDKSGNGRDASQTTSASQPTDKATGLNGKHVLTFDGLDDFFNVDLDFLAGVPHSAFVVTKVVSANNIYGAANPNAGANSLHVGFNGSTYRMNFWSNDYTPARTANFKSGAANLVNYVWNTGVGKEIFANGSSEGSNSNAGNIGTMSGGGRISNITGHGFYGGDIAEIIIKTGTVSQVERELFEGYLAHKWGLQANLPVGHPYTNMPPSGGLAVATLDATVNDPNGDSVTQVWTKVGGPAFPVAFGDASAVDTTASFSEVGVYTLRLTADDGLGQSSDQVEITVVTMLPLTVVIADSQISENGGTTTATITRLGTNGALEVSLTSSDTGEATVPATVTIPDGLSSVDVTITGVPDAVYDTDQTVTITASAAQYTDGSDTLVVTNVDTLSFMVTYNGNGNGGGSVPVDVLSPYNGSATVTVIGNTNALTRTGYTFTGWNTAADGSGVAYAAADTFVITNHTTLYAKWSNDPPTVDAGTNQTVYISGESPWSPADIVTEVWFDAADADTVQTNGSAVTTWLDKSGKGRNATQGTLANRPVYAANAQNGLSAIDFDGSNDSLSVGGTAFATRHVFAVLNADGETFAGWNWAFGSSTITKVPALFGQGGGTGIRSSIPEQYGQSSVVYVNGLSTTEFNPLSNFKVVSCLGSSASPSRNDWKIGSGDAFWNGKIAELIVVSDALSDSDRQKLEGYLAHKWGLQANLPVGHPYTNEAPVSVGLAVATLDATVSDLNGDSVTQVWTKIGGPVSPVDFGDASAVDTTATFYEVGVYTLSLTADDGLGQSSDQVEITVTLPHLTVSILAASISERGSTTAIISRLGTVGDLTVNLSSNDPGEATVPATATIPNGFNSVVVTITGVVDGIIDGSETVTITATAAGHAPGSDTVDVTHESGSVFRFR